MAEYTYEQLIGASWTHEQIAKEYPELIAVPGPPSPPSPPGPPSPPSSSLEPEEFEQPPQFDPNFIPESIDMEAVLNSATVGLNNTQDSPLTKIETFSPKGEVIIGEITPVNFDSLLKLIDVIIREKPTDNILIRESKLRQSTNNCIIEANMGSVLDYNGKKLNIDIINPKKYVPLFTQFRSDNNIFILDDDSNSRFVITNGEIRLFLPKQEVTAQIIENINTDNAEVVCSFTIDKETRKIIRNLSKGIDYIEYLLQESTLKAVHIPNIAIFKFNKFINDAKASKLDETNADLALRSNSFLPVEADSYDLSIFKLKDNTYTSVAKCKVGGNIDVTITELIDDVTGGNLMI